MLNTDTTQTFMDVVQKNNAVRYIENLDKSYLVIYAPTSLALLRPIITQATMTSANELNTDQDRLDSINKAKRYSSIVSMGGGKATDIAKYIAYKTSSNFICIPTMLSTNAYATDKATLVKDNKKITVQAKLADLIVLDYDLLNLSKPQNSYGLADVLSIYTALYDWDIAHRDIAENLDRDIYLMASELLDDSLSYINSYRQSGERHDYEELFNLIGRSGQITNRYGSGRPESGSEHIFARALESKIHIPHGVSVSLGIVISSIMQNNVSFQIVKALNMIGALGELAKYNVSAELIKDVLADLGPRKDRYTILNSRDPKDMSVDEIIEKFYEIEGTTF